MAKPRIIIADLDENYILFLQIKFIEKYFGKVDLEIITDREYFEELFENPQKAEILIISENLYDPSIQKHNISRIFLMTERYEVEETAELNLTKIFKYSSIKEIFNKILNKASEYLDIKNSGKKDPQIIVVTSATGGVGKTSIAMGMCSSLEKEYKRALYINCDYLQNFSYLLNDKSYISNSKIYQKLIEEEDSIYKDIKPFIRNEGFYYIPPLKSSLISLGISPKIFEKIGLLAKKSGDYDYIIFDTDSIFDGRKVSLMNIADKVIIVTKQNRASVNGTNKLAKNIDGINNDKYIFICNDFITEKENILISQDMDMNFVVSEYIEHIENFDSLKGSDYKDQTSIRKIIYLLD